MTGPLKQNTNIKLSIQGITLNYSGYDPLKIFILAVIESEMAGQTNENKAILASMIQEAIEADELPTPVLHYIPFAIKRYKETWEKFPMYEKAYQLKAVVKKEDLLHDFYKEILTPYETILELDKKDQTAFINLVADVLTKHENEPTMSSYSALQEIIKLFKLYVEEDKPNG